MSFLFTDIIVHGKRLFDKDLLCTCIMCMTGYLEDALQWRRRGRENCFSYSWDPQYWIMVLVDIFHLCNWSMQCSVSVVLSCVIFLCKIQHNDLKLIWQSVSVPEKKLKVDLYFCCLNKYYASFNEMLFELWLNCTVLNYGTYRLFYICNCSTHCFVSFFCVRFNLMTWNYFNNLVTSC